MIVMYVGWAVDYLVDGLFLWLDFFSDICR